MQPSDQVCAYYLRHRTCVPAEIVRGTAQVQSRLCVHAAILHAWSNIDRKILYMYPFRSTTAFNGFDNFIHRCTIAYCERPKRKTSGICAFRIPSDHISMVGIFCIATRFSRKTRIGWRKNRYPEQMVADQLIANRCFFLS